MIRTLLYEAYHLRGREDRTGAPDTRPSITGVVHAILLAETSSSRGGPRRAGVRTGDHHPSSVTGRRRELGRGF